VGLLPITFWQIAGIKEKIHPNPAMIIQVKAHDKGSDNLAILITSFKDIVAPTLYSTTIVESRIKRARRYFIVKHCLTFRYQLALRDWHSDECQSVALEKKEILSTS
jgi:hypothetical protein